MLLKTSFGLHIHYPILRVNNGISQLVKMKTYEPILRPVLTYAVAIWHDLPKYLIRTMKVFENKCLRMASRGHHDTTSTNLLNICMKLNTKTPRLNKHL